MHYGEYVNKGDKKVCGQLDYWRRDKSSSNGAAEHGFADPAAKIRQLASSLLQRARDVQCIRWSRASNFEASASNSSPARCGMRHVDAPCTLH